MKFQPIRLSGYNERNKNTAEKAELKREAREPAEKAGLKREAREPAVNAELDEIKHLMWKAAVEREARQAATSDFRTRFPFSR